MLLGGHPPACGAPPSLRHLWRDRATEKMRLKNQVAAPLACRAPPTPRLPAVKGIGGRAGTWPQLSGWGRLARPLQLPGSGGGPCRREPPPRTLGGGLLATPSTAQVAALAAQGSRPLAHASLDFPGPRGDHRNLCQLAPPPPGLLTLQGEEAAAPGPRPSGPCPCRPRSGFAELSGGAKKSRWLRAIGAPGCRARERGSSGGPLCTSH